MMLTQVSGQPVAVLVIEDDPIIGRAITQGIQEAGGTCTLADNGRDGLSQALAAEYDAIVLDLMLPETHGLDVLARLRGQGVQTPIIILTALGSIDDRVQGLGAGADDYLVKPFALVELLARLHAVCRRSHSSNATPATAIGPALQRRVGDLSLDLATRRAMRSGRQIDLTPTEFSILDVLMQFAGQLVTRKMICEHVWGSNWDGTTNVLEVHINHLRNKLDRASSDGSDESCIRTVRGRGYAFQLA